MLKNLRLISALFFISAAAVSLSGCATAPLYSNAKIPNENLNDKYKVAIKKENIVFNSGSFLSKDMLSGKQVAIYNCLGKEIYDRIPGVGVFMVDKRPANPNIIYIHDYSNEKTWWIPNAGDVTAMAFGLLGDMIGKEPNRAVFTANVLINGKNYPIKADATVIQPILSTNAKKLLKKVCGNFEKKFINLLLVEKTNRGVGRSHSNAVYSRFRKTAEQGNVKGQYNLGVAYYYGKGVKQSYSKALYWFRKAAEQGNADAQLLLGLVYYSGHGVSRSYSKAVYWFKKSAEQGNMHAQNNLGAAYDSGKGVEPSYSKAVYWYKKSAAQGDMDAKKNLSKIEGR